MTLKTLPAALSLVLAASLTAFAQAPQQPTPEAQAPAAQTAPTPARTPNPHRQAMRIARELNLTPDQTSKIEPILADRDQKIAALRADSSVTPRDAKKQMHAIQQNTRSQLSNVLTADQLQQLERMQHNHGAKDQAQPASPAPTV